MGRFAEEYKKKYGELIPTIQVMSNEILCNKFNDNPEEVYQYCLEHNITWKEALKAEIIEDNPNVVY